MKIKPITPYERLRRKALKFLSQVKYPKRKVMWLYPKAKLNDTWTLADLYERVAAADQLGYDVIITAVEEGLRVSYQARPDTNEIEAV